MPMPEPPYFWQKDASIALSWESVGVMLSIAIAVVGLAVAYFRIFVKGEILEAKENITERFTLELREMLEMQSQRLEHRIDKIEQEMDEKIRRRSR